MTAPLRRTGSGLAAVVLAGVACVSPLRAEESDASLARIWQRVRADLFQDRPIEADASRVLLLDAPTRAEDAAIVPITIHAQAAQPGGHRIERLYLVIDGNPSPVAAVFHFAAASGRSDIETRVRVEQYTTLRAIAELDDGSLHMVTRGIKASGGCSAPAGKDAAAALAGVGRMRIHVDEPVAVGRPVQAQLMISHPNSSGLAMDPMTRLYAPPYFVRRVTVSYAGRPVMDADVDFSISENPNFRFFFVPDGGGELKAEVVDSHDLTFTAGLAVHPRLAGAEAAAR